MTWEKASWNGQLFQLSLGRLMNTFAQPLPMEIHIYDAYAPWDALRSGMTAPMPDGSPGVWFAGRSVEELKQPTVIYPLEQFNDRLRPHIMMHALNGRPDDGFEKHREIYA